MGLADWILNLGIRVEQAATGFGTRAGAVALQWPAGHGGGSVIYRLPRDPHQRASIFAAAQQIVVNEGEVAVVLEDGKSMGDLPPGRYVFQKARVTGSLDIVWIRTGQQSLKWGVGNVASTDGIQISANGVAYVRLLEGRLFNSEVVQGAITLTEVELQRFLMPRIQGVIRTTVAKAQALELQTQREVFTDAVKRALSETFAGLGLGIVDFEVVEINFPPEFKAVIAQATLATHGSRAALIEAQTRAQMIQIEAVAQAQAQLASGIAQVQVMAQLQAQGIDPLRLKALEALNTYAEHPSQGGLIGDPGKAQLFGQLAMAAVMPGVPVAPAPALPMAPMPPVVPAAPQAAPAAEPAAEGGASAADLERQIDALVERLAEGKITEETYKKLAARLEAKLANLKGG